MALGQARPTGLAGQLTRFVVVGVLAAGVDFGVYQLLLALGCWAVAAKAVSFVIGTGTAYALNRRWTFDSAGGAAPAARFAALYAGTFFVNVGVNALLLHLLDGYRWQVPLAWVSAQAAATVINFVLLRAVVFRPDATAVSTEEHLGMRAALDSALAAFEDRVSVTGPHLFDGLAED